MDLDRGTVIGRARHRDLELARKIGEFRVQARPLTDQFADRAGIGNLVRRDTGPLVGRDIADAVAAGLDGVHLHVGEIVEEIRHLFQPGPVVLDVLARGEMAVSAVVFFGDVGQLPQLDGRQRAVGDCDAQHIGVKLQVESVHQPERLELFFRDFACEASGHLFAELGHPFPHEAVVKFVVTIHPISYP